MPSFREYYSFTGDDVEDWRGAFKQVFNSIGYTPDTDSDTDMACMAYGAWAVMHVIWSMNTKRMGAIKDYKEMLNRWSLFITNGGIYDEHQ